MEFSWEHPLAHFVDISGVYLDTSSDKLLDSPCLLRNILFQISPVTTRKKSSGMLLDISGYCSKNIHWHHAFIFRGVYLEPSTRKLNPVANIVRRSTRSHEGWSVSYGELVEGTSIHFSSRRMMPYQGRSKPRSCEVMLDNPCKKKWDIWLYNYICVFLNPAGPAGNSHRPASKKKEDIIKGKPAQP